MEAVNTIICPQCAGENQIPVDEKFLECQFCGSAIYIDKKKIVNHFVITSNFKQNEAEGNLRRWMAGNFQVKDLDKLAKITEIKFYYFPMWYFKTDAQHLEKIYLQPATSTAISEIKKINIPAGSLKVFNKKDFDMSQFIEPDVLYDSAQSWLAQTGVDVQNTIAESNLVHIPFYHFNYEYKGKIYTALVEASSGMVYANLWPAKSEIPFRILFVLSLFAFFFVSLVSLVLSLKFSESKSDFFLGIEFIKIFAYGIISVPLIILAYIVAKKV